MGPASYFVGPLVISYFLQAGTEALDNPCPRGWMFRTKNCYGFFINRMKWSEAELDCQGYGLNGHLASIHNKEEMEAVATYIKSSFISKGHVWIGMYDPKSGNARHREWKWTDSSPVHYSPWGPGEPYGDIHTSSNDNCVELHSDGGFLLLNDETCEYKHPFLCKYSLSDQQVAGSLSCPS